jgi:NADH:ubiquinone oxidoreductase subunit F (NADH-binding)
MQILKKTNLDAFRKSRQLGPEKVIELIKKKGLTGRGGANFPTGQKLSLARKSESPEKFIICNADESEPGAFKDRFILEKNPENIIEGIMIAAYVLGAKTAFIYIRGAYHHLIKNIKNEIKKFNKEIQKLNLSIEIIEGAGSYVCGDETAIISSIMGTRSEPKIKPPFPYDEGLFGKPTLVDNVETLANIPLLINEKEWDKNLRLFSLSGNLNAPGVYEMPLGTPLKKILDLGKPKNNIKAVYFGCAGGCVPYSNIRITYSQVKKAGCCLGPCTIIAADNTKNILDMSINIAKFFEYESCGKCLPCREGTMRMLELLEKLSLGKASKNDLELLKGLAETVSNTSLCGLGKSSANHIFTALKYFKEDFEKKCI